MNDHLGKKFVFLTSLFSLLLSFFLLVSCGSTATPEVTENPTITPTKTVRLIPSDSPTLLPPASTELQLPYDDSDIENVYCLSPNVNLPDSDTSGLNDDEITGKLLGLWLTYFNNAKAPAYCRIDGYRIDKIYFGDPAYYEPLEPQGDFMRTVQFSVKLIQVPNFWMGWMGVIDQQNWLHISHDVAIFHSSGSYSMKFANP